MLSNILKYELKTIFRSGWLFALISLFVAFIAFAAYNGYEKVSQRTRDIADAVQDLKESDAIMLENIAKIEAGEKTELPYWKLPTEPSVVGARHPRLTTMDPSKLALLSTGQSDMYSHFMEVSSYGYNFAIDINEISNPIQLLFGTFDLAFVFMFIIPLLIIAFTYNLLSKEKELGTLRILGSQPINVTKWLIQKMLIRFILFAVCSLFVLLICLGIFAPQAFQNPTALLLAVLQILSYELFWFVLSIIINIKVNNSAKNAMMLIGLWLLIVLIIPVTANQLGNALYPSPSRMLMLNELRHINQQLEEKREEILDSYLQDHPELATEDDTKKYNFWHKYYAAQDVLRKEVEPLIASHEAALNQRQQVVQVMKYVSPAIVLQESFSKLAGTSAQDYKNYKKQLMEYTDAWRGHIIPLLFKDEKYNLQRYEERPIFQYRPANNTGLLLKNILISLVMILFVCIAARFLFKNKSYFN